MHKHGIFKIDTYNKFLINTERSKMKESGAKKGFVLYNDYKDMCDDLTDEEAGQLFKAIFAHEAGEEGPHLEGPLKGIFHLIANQLDRDRAKYQDKVITNQKNGSLGGRPKNKR